MKALNTIIGIAVVAVVGYFALKWLKSAATQKSGSGGGSSGGSSGGGGGKDVSGLLQQFQNFIAGLNTKEGPALDQLLQQSDQAIADSISNDFIPLEDYQNPFDAAGISFPINSSGLDTTASDTSGSNISSDGGVDASTDPFLISSDLEYTGEYADWSGNDSYAPTYA